MRTGKRAVAAIGALAAWAVLMAGTFLAAPASGTPGGAVDGGKYIGAEKCKKCHESKAMGSQFSKWKETRHAKAWETLATDAAKAIAKEKGIDDPQKADACVKCHVTAFGVADDQLDKSFNRENVQCEACHGPGGNHAKARLADDDEDDKSVREKALKEMPPPNSKELCGKCHNAESPTFKEFDLEKRLAEIAHPNPKMHK